MEQGLVAAFPCSRPPEPWSHGGGARPGNPGQGGHQQQRNVSNNFYISIHFYIFIIIYFYSFLYIHIISYILYIYLYIYIYIHLYMFLS